MKREELRIKNDVRGITLIALVITIVVMLILAGVTINLTLGENGIFTTARQAAKNYTEAQNKEMAGVEDFTSTVDKAVESIQNNYEIAGTILKTENNINYTADGAGNTIPVPVGFSPITTKDQGTKDTGFVIKNDTDGNEFVWVPVEGKSYSYERYDFGYQYKEFSDYLETLPSDEESSVKKYGGYYIGRYETGIIGGTKGEIKVDGTYYTGTNMNLVIKSGQKVWNYITRDKARTISRDLYSKEIDNVTSKLCSSYAWDTALKFMESIGSTYPTNSVGGYYEQARLSTTGFDTVHPCNIYDMGGNVWEWTTESSTTNIGVNRGGFYASIASGSVAAFRNSESPYAAEYAIGFRVALYI